MKTLKEELIEKVVFGMTDNLDKDNLNKLLYLMVIVFKDVDVCSIDNERHLSIDLTNDDLILKNFLGSKKLKGCTDSTIIRYRQNVNNLHNFLHGKSYVSITSYDIKLYLAECTKTMNSTSVNGVRKCLNSFFQWMTIEEIIKNNPCLKVDSIKNEKTIRPLVSQIDMVKLKDNCIDMREHVIVDILDSCGLRCMEVPTIKIKDIDFNTKTMKIKGKGRKERTVMLTDECLEHIKNYLNERQENNIMTDYLIGRHRDKYLNKPLDKNSIQRIVKRIKKRANVNHVAIHGIRHKFASDLNRRGMNVFSIQQLLGHASISTTQIYVDMDYSNIAQEYNKYKN